MRARDATIGEQRKLARGPAGPWIETDCTRIAHPRGGLNVNEHWAPFAYANNHYAVQISLVSTAIGTVIHLWINRHDRTMPSSWSDLQAIKNRYAGADRVAVQVFPPVDEIVDQAPMAHLWVYPPDTVLPFTLKRGS